MREINIPQSINKEARLSALPAIKAIWAIKMSGADPDGLSFNFNPFSFERFSYYYFRALAVTSNDDAKEILTDVSLQVAIQWIFEVIPAIKTAKGNFQKWKTTTIKPNDLVAEVEKSGYHIVDANEQNITLINASDHRKGTIEMSSRNLNNIKWIDDVVETGGHGQVGSLESLLNNKIFREIYEPLENGNHIRKYKQYDVSILEEAALKLYIRDDFYFNFNKALSGEIIMTTEYSVMRELLISAYSKLPKQINIIVFRGAGGKESFFAKNLVIGQKFDFGGRFTSASIDDYTADLFRRGNNGDIIW